MHTMMNIIKGCNHNLLDSKYLTWMDIDITLMDIDPALQH